jgi:glycosyltransferase involved in cell wall biosynthesis
VALFATSVAFGGIERVLLTLLRHMEPGIELVPILFTRTDTKETTFFERLRAMGIPHETLYVNSVRPALIVNPVVNLAQAVRFVRKQRFDLIHSHGYRADAFAFAVSKLFGLPIVSTAHGFISTDHRLRFYNALDVRVLRFFTRVIAVSATMKDDLVASGVDARRVDVVTNAVENPATAERDSSRRQTRSTLGIGEDEVVFGFVGRLSEEKGLDHLLQSAVRLSAESRPIRLLIVGEGPLKDGLMRAARERGLSTKVDFVGFQSDTARWYAAMDAFVLPSLTEGTPMALLEAMAHRLPVVASAVGGVPAVVSHGENGLLVPPADEAALVDAMRCLMTDASLREKLSERAIQSIRRAYGVDTWIRQVREVYTKTLQEVRRQ